MARNLDQTKNSNVTRACAVPAGTKSGDVLKLGDHLTAWAITDRATAATIAAGSAPHNLADGEATCELAGVGTTVRLTMKGAGTRYDLVARAADGTYGPAAGKGVGVALSDYANGDVITVALMGNLPDLV